MSCRPGPAGCSGRSGQDWPMVRQKRASPNPAKPRHFRAMIAGLRRGACAASAALSTGGPSAANWGRSRPDAEHQMLNTEHRVMKDEAGLPPFGAGVATAQRAGAVSGGVGGGDAGLGSRRGFVVGALRWGGLVALGWLGVDTVRRHASGRCSVAVACVRCGRWERCELPPAREARRGADLKTISRATP
jgi:hypothetical protein